MHVLLTACAWRKSYTVQVILTSQRVLLGFWMGSWAFSSLGWRLRWGRDCYTRLDPVRVGSSLRNGWPDLLRGPCQLLQ